MPRSSRDSGGGQREEALQGVARFRIRQSVKGSERRRKEPLIQD